MMVADPIPTMNRAKRICHSPHPSLRWQFAKESYPVPCTLHHDHEDDHEAMRYGQIVKWPR